MPNRRTGSGVEGSTWRFTNYGNTWLVHGSVRWTTQQSKELGLHVVLEGLSLREKAVAGTAGQSGYFGRFVQQHGYGLAQSKLQPVGSSQVKTRPLGPRFPHWW